MSKVFDTNILIYHLNDQLSEEADSLLAEALEEGASISVITRIEILGWPGKTEDSLQQSRNLLAQFHEQPLTNGIVERCIELRQQRRIKIPDAIIAATALDLDLPLVTRNTDDFKGIAGLVLIDPFSPEKKGGPSDEPKSDS